MSGVEPIYVVINRSGRVWNGRPGVMTWFSILDAIHVEFMSAGGEWDRPDKLLVNGEMVVASGLADIAWEYGEKLKIARFAAQDKVNADFSPDWYAKLAVKRGVAG